MSTLDVSGFMMQDFDGQGKTFDEACQNAWRKANDAGHQSPQMVQGQRYSVELENPVSEHIVIITPSDTA